MKSYTTEAMERHLNELLLDSAFAVEHSNGYFRVSRDGAEGGLFLVPNGVHSTAMIERGPLEQELRRIVQAADAAVAAEE